MVAEYLGSNDRSFRQFPLEFVPCCHSSLPTQLNSCAESLVRICIMQCRCVHASTTNVESCILHTGVLKKKKPRFGRSLVAVARSGTSVDKRPAKLVDSVRQKCLRACFWMIHRFFSRSWLEGFVIVGLGNEQRCSR